MKAKLAIVVGHNSVKKGAVRVSDGKSEYDYNVELAKRIEQVAVDFLDVKIFYRQPGIGYPAEVHKVYKAVDAWGADASIELHFNSVEDQNASGTLTLSSGTKESLALASVVQEAMVTSLKLRDRGVITRSTGRGSQSLMSGKCPAVLIEPYFGSNLDDCKVADKSIAGLAYCIAAGAYHAILNFPRKDMSESRTLGAVADQKEEIRKQNNNGVLGASASLGAVALSMWDTLRTMFLGSSETPREAVEGIQWLTEYLPLPAGLLALVAVMFFMAQRANSQKIEAKSDWIEMVRHDDNRKGLR